VILFKSHPIYGNKLSSSLDKTFSLTFNNLLKLNSKTIELAVRNVSGVAVTSFKVALIIIVAY